MRKAQENHYSSMLRFLVVRILLVSLGPLATIGGANFLLLVSGPGTARKLLEIPQDLGRELSPRPCCRGALCGQQLQFGGAGIGRAREDVSDGPRERGAFLRIWA